MQAGVGVKQMMAVAVRAIIDLETRRARRYAARRMRSILSIGVAVTIALTSGLAPGAAYAEETKATTKKAQKAKAKAKKSKTAKKEVDPEFAKRFAALKGQEGISLVAIQMKPTDNPDLLPDMPALGAGPVLVAGKRGGIYTPPILSSDDILDVVNAEMKTIRRCYKAQLEADPEWSDDLILDLSVKKTGRVSEVSIAPKRVMRAEIGKCLMTQIPKWKFPTFTGELEDGVTQEVVNASFPFTFSVN